MKNALTLLLLAAACNVPTSPQQQSSNSADTDNPWCHADLTSTNETQMVFDYQVAQESLDGAGEEWYATNVWLNVANPSFQPDDSASAVVIVYSYPGPCGSPCGNPSIVSTNTIPLTWQNGRFTASVPDMPIFSFPPDDDGSDSTGYYWELAVVENGTWYKDPNTGNNLSVTLREDTNYCATGTTF